MNEIKKNSQKVYRNFNFLESMINHPDATS